MSMQTRQPEAATVARTAADTTISARIQALELLTPVPRTRAILGLRDELSLTAYLELVMQYRDDFLDGERRMKAVQAMAELRPSLQQRDLSLSADFEEALEWINRLTPPAAGQKSMRRFG